MLWVLNYLDLCSMYTHTFVYACSIKPLASLHIYAGAFDPSLLDNVKRTEIS